MPPCAQAQRESSTGLGRSEPGLYRSAGITAVRKKGQNKNRNRSISQFSGDLREMAEAAANDIESITLFQDPLPDPYRSQDILETVWSDVEQRFGIGYPEDVKVDSYVS